MLKEVESAMTLAAAAHVGQVYGDRPYIDHLIDVVEILFRFKYIHVEEKINVLCITGSEITLVQAALLHDAIEDTALTKEIIEEVVGERVADIVWRVTCEPGKNRKERYEKTYPKIKENKNAVLIKLADRIANIENCIRTKDSRFKMYKKEYPEFEKQLRDGKTAENLWIYLEGLMEIEV